MTTLPVNAVTGPPGSDLGHRHEVVGRRRGDVVVGELAAQQPRAVAETLEIAELRRRRDRAGVGWPRIGRTAGRTRRRQRAAGGEDVGNALRVHRLVGRHYQVGADPDAGIEAARRHAARRPCIRRLGVTGRQAGSRHRPDDRQDQSCVAHGFSPNLRHTIQQTPTEHQLAFPARCQVDRGGDALAALPWTPAGCQLAFRSLFSSSRSHRICQDDSP
jgi:hypothetical protein